MRKSRFFGLTLASMLCATLFASLAFLISWQTPNAEPALAAGQSIYNSAGVRIVQMASVGSTIFVGHNAVGLGLTKSTNAGSNFSTSFVPMTNTFGFAGLAAVDANNLFYFGVELPAAMPSYTFTNLHGSASTNGGSSWNNDTSFSGLGTINYVSEVRRLNGTTVGMITTGSGTDGVQFRTFINGGAAVQNVLNTSVLIRNASNIQGSIVYPSLFAVNATTLFATFSVSFPFVPPQTGFIKSTDGGNTWSTVSTVDPAVAGIHTTITALDANTIFIAYESGGNLYFAKSANGGSSWTTKQIGPVYTGANDFLNYSIDAFDANNIVIAYTSTSATDPAIAFTSDGGTTWGTQIVDNTCGGATQVRLKTTAATQGYLTYTCGLQDVRFSNYTLVAAPVVNLTAPNGGQTFTVGASTNITYNATQAAGATITGITLEFSSNNGVGFSSIAVGVANTGTYAWTVPNNATTQGRIRVTATNSAGLTTSAMSAAAFTIAAAPPPPPTPGACNPSTHNTCRWAWSDTIGWISHNSIDNPSVLSYGMHIDETTGTVSGYLWNEAAGWINLAPASGYPAAPNNGVKFDPATRQLSGWAQIVGYGANGWIKFRDTSPIAYGVNIAANGDFSGYAWNDLLGWFEFAPTGGYPAVKQTTSANPSVSGWIWNNSLGWISTRNTDYDIDYGVDMDGSGNLKGYAWSEIGWIQYDPAGPYPSAPFYASKWDPTSQQVTGWAKATSMIGGWAATSWIKMSSSSGDPVSYNTLINKTTGDWSGYAWNDTFGWIAYSTAYSTVRTTLPSTGPVTPVLTTPLNCVDTYTTQPATPLSPTLDWSDYVALDGTTQAAFEIMVDDDSLFLSPVFDDTVSSTASIYSVGLGQLNYNIAYYWRVRVRSSSNVWSNWGTTGIIGSETNCFRTPKHPAPVCNFTMNPNPPALNVDTQFTDTTTTYGGATMTYWAWNFGDGTPVVSGTNPATHKNPKHKYTSNGNVTIIMSGTDSDNYACSKNVSASVAQNLPDFRRVIPR